MWKYITKQGIEVVKTAIINYYTFKKQAIFLSNRMLREVVSEKKNITTVGLRLNIIFYKKWIEEYLHFEEREKEIIAAIQEGKNIRLIAESGRGKTRTLIECIRKLVKTDETFKNTHLIVFTKDSNFKNFKIYRRMYLKKWTHLILLFDDIDKIITEMDENDLSILKVIDGFSKASKKIKYFCTCRSEKWHLAGKTSLNMQALLKNKEEIEQFFDHEVTLHKLTEEQGKEIARKLGFKFPELFNGNAAEILMQTQIKKSEYDLLKNDDEKKLILKAIKLFNIALGGKPIKLDYLKKVSGFIFSVKEFSKNLEDLENAEYFSIESDYLIVPDTYVLEVVHDYPTPGTNMFIEDVGKLIALLENEKAVEELTKMSQFFSFVGLNNLTLLCLDVLIKIADPSNKMMSFALLHNKGNKYFKMRNYNIALKNYGEALEKDVPKEKKAATYAVRGKLFKEIGENSKALKDFNKAIKLDPEMYLGYYNRAKFYLHKERYDEALKDYNKVIALKPRYSNAYNARGVVYIKLNRKEEALADFTKAIVLNPNNSSAYRNRSRLQGGY